MKRIGAFSLAIFIFVLSVFSVIPVYADGDKTVLPCNLKQTMAFSSSDAQAYVAAHKDIYSQDGYLLFAYTPAASYNWNLCKDGQLTNIHMSDKQVANYIMTNRPFMSMYTVLSSLLSNNNSFRGFCSGLGAIFLKDSDAGTKILDTLTGNYNYLDSLNYDEDSKTITMSNDNGSVDKLREEIRNYYYDSIGLIRIKPSGTVKQYVDSTAFHHLFEYEEDYTSAFNGVVNSKYCFADKDSNLSYHAFFWDTTKYVYMSDDVAWAGDSLGNRVYKLMSYDGENSFDFSTDNVKYCSYYGNSSDLAEIKGLYTNKNGSYYNGFYGLYDNTVRYYSFFSGVITFKYYPFSFYSADGSYFEYFKSYSALYNFLHGDQNAYLSSKIEETGKDISYSIKDMNENLGTKMDELIDSINSGKGNMSADELQNAIDKGLEDLNKNTEDIKDNTSSILDKLEEQNQILLQILGVTEFIAYQEVKENSDQYNMSYLKTLLDSMFTGLFNALMYGENTVDDKNTDTASMQSFSVSNAAAPVAVYSDDIAVYDSSGSGGGSSFGGGSDSSGGHFFDLKNGLFGKFPFSIPYQCYNWLQILQRDPEAPTFTLDYGYLFGCSGDPKFVLSFDLSRYNDIAEVGRSFCRLFMTLMLALGIYHKNKGEM